MSEIAPVAETVARYFFFSTLDESLTFSHSLRALNHLKSRNWLLPNHRAEWVRTLHNQRLKLQRNVARVANISAQRRLTWPANFDIAVWATFLSNTEFNQSEAVLLSRILGLTDEEIAQGLNVTEGTVRYRVSKGLQKLGGLLGS